VGSPDLEHPTTGATRNRVAAIRVEVLASPEGEGPTASTPRDPPSLPISIGKFTETPVMAGGGRGHRPGRTCDRICR
jgi:hypothetical protein